MKSSLLLFLTFFSAVILTAQPNDYSSYGKLHRFELVNTPFPDSERDSGHVYKGEHFPKAEHYNDSTTLVFVPDYLDIENSFDIVFYFHGWNNNVDKSLSKFNLIEQFHSSGRKAMLVLAEGPKDAPDSFGGKLEEKGVFKLLVDEIISELERVYNLDLEFENISLTGHSGAYRVIAYILLHSGLTDKINEVILFDALYADVEKYAYWLDHYDGRFINIYTQKGGTKYESENLMQCLTAWNMPYTFIKSDEFTDSQLKEERIIFISSGLGHSEVISTQDQLKRFLECGD